MNSSNYMDKQITDLSKTPIRTFLDDEDDDDEEEEDHQDQGFDFYPIRSVHSHAKVPDGIHLRNGGNCKKLRLVFENFTCKNAHYKTPFNFLNFHHWVFNEDPNFMGWSSDQHSTKFSGEKAGSFSDAELISRIDQKLKEHADVLLHSVECLSARLSQMESRTRQVENNFDDLKESIEFNHERTDRKLKELENILIEVHGGIKDLRDKQEIAETQLQLAKLRVSKDVSKDDAQLEKQNNDVQSSLGTVALSSVSQQSNQQLPVPVACPQQVLSLSSNIKNLPVEHRPLTKPAATAPKYLTPSASQLPTITATAPQLPSQLLTSFVPSVPQQESHYTLPVSTPGTIHQKYVLPTQQSQPPYIHQPCQPPSHLPPNSHFPQLPHVQLPFSAVNPQVQSHHPEVSFVPSQGIHKSSQPHDWPLPPQLLYVGSTDLPSNLRYSERTSANTPPGGYTNIVDFYHYSAPTHSGSAMKPVQPSPSPPSSTGETNFSKLPTARILPRAIPTASSVDSESSSGEGGNRAPVDNVVDKVVAMGFRRDLVRATVKKLTENGQSVDLNTVLDKLMNSG